MMSWDNIQESPIFATVRDCLKTLRPKFLIKTKYLFT